MNRTLSLVAAAAVLAGLSSAQCYVQNIGTLAPNAAGTPGIGDDLLFDVVPMNFSFPINGSSATYTHAQVSTNGLIYLTNGAASNGTASGYPVLADLQGIAGDAPRIAAMWIDLDFLPANNGAVYINNTVPGRLTVTWLNAQEWNVPSPVFTVQAQLFANGNVIFTYGGNAATTLPPMTGVSGGNGIAAVPPVDLSAGGNTGTTDLMFEQQATGVFDLGALTLTFTRNGGGGYTQTVGACANAYNLNYGTGCYDLSDSFYQLLPDSSTAPATLNGQSLQMTLLGNDYLALWGGATYVPPGAGAVTLTISDDGEQSVTPSIPLPTPAGPQTALFIHGNGMVSAASNNAIQGNNYQPNAAGFLNAPATAFFSWHDFNTSEAGSGQIKYEEVTSGGTTMAYVTWDDVENYSNPAAVNRSTMQFQLNLTTGDVAIVWVSMDGDPTSIYGSAHLIGYSTVGASADAGSINLATSTPFVTNNANMTSISVSAAPAPVSTATSGSNVVYTTVDIPEFVTGSGLYVALAAFSLGQVPGGLDLGFIGAPGCSAYIQSLDFTIAMVGTSPTATATLALPAGVPNGTQIFEQSVALVAPNSLPNGQNQFGLVSSNGVKSNVAPF